MEHTSTILKEKGLKQTPQRLVIYNILSNTDTHPTAEMIYNNLEGDYKSMSLATVYKTLNSFIEKGLVQELNVTGESVHYDANVDIHPHFICNTCKNVFDIKLDDFHNLTKNIENSFCDKDLFEIESYQLNLYGKCSECKNS